MMTEQFDSVLELSNYAIVPLKYNLDYQSFK